MNDQRFWDGAFFENYTAIAGIISLGKQKKPDLGGADQNGGMKRDKD